MKYIDAYGMTPEALKAAPRLHEAWLRHLRETEADATVLEDDEACVNALQTLRRLEYADVELVTTPDRFMFWCLVPEVVMAIDPSGTKKMGKPARTDDPWVWAHRQVHGMMTKAETTKRLQQIQRAVEAKDEDGLSRRDLAVIAVYRAFMSGVPGETQRALIEVDGDYTLVDSPDMFDEFLRVFPNMAKDGGRFSFDTETDSAGEEDSDARNPYTERVVGFSLCAVPHTGYYFPLQHSVGQNFNALVGFDIIDRLAFEYPSVMHNAKYDITVTSNPVQLNARGGDDWWDAWFEYIQQGRVDDTMLMAAVASLPSAKLKVLAKTLLGAHPIDFKRLTRGRPFSTIPPEIAAKYAAQDADWTLRLYPILKAMLAERDGWEDVSTTHIYEDVERPLLEYFIRLERGGMYVDRELVLKQQAKWEPEHQRRYQLFLRLARAEGLSVADDFNINSPIQMQHLLYKQMKMPVLERTKTGAPSTGEKALNALRAAGVSSPVFSVLLAWKEAEKNLSAFIYPLLGGQIQSDGRVRTNVHQIGAGTGRTSMSDPNPQQFYKELRKSLKTEPRQWEQGEIASIDYSQIELRVLAAIHNEPKMISIFNLPPFLPDGKPNPDADIHGLTQREVGLPNRTKAKNFNFGAAFEAGAGVLSVTAGLPMAQTRAFLARFWQAYSSYAASKAAMQKRDVARGYTATWDGRIRVFNPRLRLDEWMRQSANTPIQGGALDIAKHAAGQMLPLIREAERVGIEPYMFVHDEFDFAWSGKGPRKVWNEFLREAMRVMVETNPFKDLLPLAVDLEIGRSWGEVAEPKEVMA